ncbi:DUF1302 domain-containing protein [Herminiimonas arsenitoxidans]|uniref:DUF1302 domain-containing protein n=1 Tax=Herminiimonas arsenitoxidans TaxID=1809410 RepID=UPI000970EAA5|nr:DUF1302 family protein [Herminiimonas arsenitoxidans]
MNKGLMPTRIALSIWSVFAVAAAVSGVAQAAAITTDNTDVEMRWDNTVRYNAGWRAENSNPAFYKSSGYDETEGGGKSGDMMANRLDILSEFDFTYKGKYGFRVSAAGWADGAYGSRSWPNPALGLPSNYRGGEYNGYAKRYVVGPSAEFLDAFVFGRFDLGSTSLNVKAGQHNVYWGESLYSLGNSIAYSQGPVDTIKAASSPGVEAKETFLPQKQISGQWSLTDEVSVGAYYAFAWNPYRLAPGGTYFATGDATRSDFANVAPLIPNGPDIRPKNRGDFGLNTRWSPEWMNGTVGLYYRKFDEKLPWGVTQAQPLAAPSAIRLAFARDTELYGMSFTKNLNTLSLGSEISYRKNTALNSNISVVPANGTSLTYEEAEGARGNTLHALVNGVYLLPKSALWDGGTLSVELNYSRLLSVTSHADRFNGIGYACSKTPSGVPGGIWSGCSTKDAWGTNINFTPSWPQAMPGWDLSMPTTVAYQIKGNGAALGGGNEGALSYSIGVAGTLYSRYDFSLRYVDSYAQYATNALGVMSTQNGGAVQNNHGWLSFTFKTTF